MTLERRLRLALNGLETAEGLSFERLMRQVLMDAMKAEKGNIFVRSREEIGGYWSKNKRSLGDIDVCAVSFDENIVWAISCKRNPEKHTKEVELNYRALASDLIESSPELRGRNWETKFAVASPYFENQRELWCQQQGWEVLDLAKMLHAFSQ
jgi:uncharacterized membrane protein (UPF0127 family)